ncbi:T9SS type A sorting domain-containing protein [Chitinophaga tropicalis]|uniref:T9SS type A sorting domain-containing protein n=1 Tax=Chitinophaga tropicalis TaxID=2683588 RepID=A0A7K1U1H5_9BACT|nr:T9SS type A sorting domain-containing protein [Chitinophaga tropicalis]MVT08209.1 T9SS type A sorting domain-containing protein [Chitinophaga tropicalis]
MKTISELLKGKTICLQSLLIGTLSLSIAGNSVKAQTYGSVAIGGGGFVSGIIPSKTEANLIYARTDVGGAYRWDNANSRWIPLLDWVSSGQTSYLGVESLAIDPINSNNVYMLVGTSYFNGGITAILRSSDKGNSFSVTDVTSQFKTNGNGMGRQNGEKLQVDPNNNTILYCGTRANGLFKSTNSGVSWSRLTSLNVTTTANGNGVSFVVLDKSSVSGGATQRIFVGVSQTGTNFYRSNNGGSSFTAVSGAPTSLMPQRAVLASDGNLYITYADKEGPWNPSTGQVWKYNVSSGAWTNVTPSGITSPFSGISVDPNNASRLMLSTINVYNSQGGAWGDQFYYSTNGGSSWTNVVSRGFTLNSNGVPWLNSSQSIHWAGCIEFDPFSTSKVWVTSGNGVFRNDAIETSGTWNAMVKNLEETVPLDMVSIPGGPIMSAIGDYDGFKQTSPSAYGTQHAPTMGSNSGIAYAAASTSKLVRVGSSIYYTTNQGSSWTQTNLPPANGSTASNSGYVALSTSGGRILYSPANGNNTTMYYSTNNGSSWTTVGGISFNTRPVSDLVTDNRFYAYNQANGYLYYSTNGTSFSQGAYTGGTYGSVHVRAVPGFTGHVWVALYGGGLAYTTNGISSGTAFTKLSNVSACSAVGFGATASGASYPTVYIWGTVNGVEGVYRSVNRGTSWTRINDNDHEWGGPGNGQFVIGDMNTYGRVYISTAGRGIAYIESGSVSSARTANSILEEPAVTKSKVSAFPNPVTDMLKVQLTDDQKESRIFLLNSNGQVVFFGRTVNSLYNISMSELPTGIYYLKIEKEGKSTVTKVVKR